MMRFLIEGQVELLLSAIINIELLNETSFIFTNVSDAIAFTTGIVFLLMIVMMPLFIAYITMRMVDTIQINNDMPLDANNSTISEAKE